MDRIYKSPIVSIINDSEFELAEEFAFYWTEGQKDLKFTLPAGFVFDGASVPRFCWSLTGLLPTGVHLGAAAVHDEAYKRRGLLTKGQVSLLIGDDKWLPVDTQWDRKQCDDMFKRIMIAAEETSWKANAMYWAVRIFGGAAWNH